MPSNEETDMSTNYSPNDLDALIAFINQAIAAAPGDTTALVRIADAVREHARAAKSGAPQSTDLLNTLLTRVCPPVRTAPTKPALTMMQPAFGRGAAGQADIPPMVKTAEGRRILLGKCLGRGGEGTVYKVPALPGKVAKIYKSDRFSSVQARQTMERKIRLLVKKKKVAYINDTLVAAIPSDVLYYDDGTFAGYVMPQISTAIKIFEVQREDRRRKIFPDLDYRGLIVIAYNLAEVVDHLHRNGIIVGDMNQNNIMVYQDGTVALIDCDSFDISDPDTGEHFPCTVGLQELLAPELQTAGRLADVPFTKESDCFSLAIHIFRLLMDNADPFGFRLTGNMRTSSSDMLQLNTAIVNGDCVYVRNIPGKAIPAWAPTLDILPQEIQDLFRRVFDYTAATVMRSIGSRPTAEEWVRALASFYQIPMTHCRQDPFHWYLPTVPSCPFCRK